MTDGPWLADKSALVRLSASPDADTWFARIDRGLVRKTAVTVLEMGFSVRSGDEHLRLRSGHPLAELPLEYLTPAMEGRAIEVQGMLAHQGQHRGVSVPDLQLAACAEKTGLTILHVDKDFDPIAGITGQLVERLRLQS